MFPFHNNCVIQIIIILRLNGKFIEIILKKTNIYLEVWFLFSAFNSFLLSNTNYTRWIIIKCKLWLNINFSIKKSIFFRSTCSIINQYLTKLAQDKYYTYELTHLSSIWQNKSKTRLKCINWFTWIVSDRIRPRLDLNV